MVLHHRFILSVTVLFFNYSIIIKCFENIEASRGARAQSVTVKSTGCGCDLHSRKLNILLSKQSAALSSTNQHAMPPELGGMWGMECLNIRFPLSTLLCVGYSVKLIIKNIKRLERLYYGTNWSTVSYIGVLNSFSAYWLPLKEIVSLK